MDRRTAAAILRSLATGVDPSTGGAIDFQTVLNRPEVIRALFLGAEGLEDEPSEKRNRGRNQVRRIREADEETPPHQGESWSEEEDRRLAEAFHRGDRVGPMAAAHGRSRGAIRARLVRLGLIEDRSESPE